MKISSFFYISCFLILLTSQALASDTVITKPGLLISDGRDGRVYRQWSQRIDDPRRIEKVEFTVRRQRSGNDTFINLRFDKDGDSFEDGKRVYLDNTEAKLASFNINQNALGRTLVLNAYNGEVFVEQVSIFYESIASPIISDKPIGATAPSTVIEQHQTASEDEIRLCKRGRYRRADIDADRVRASGGLLSGKYRIQGSIYAACVEEAGYFEYGRLQKQISFPYSSRYQRIEYDFQIRSGRNGEIRVYTADGRTERFKIDSAIKDQGLF